MKRDGFMLEVYRDRRLLTPNAAPEWQARNGDLE
jgi:hypothetical protein